VLSEADEMGNEDENEDETTDKLVMMKTVEVEPYHHDSLWC
jgi:hypothetical protein